MTVNADFLISPAYLVPTMMISIRLQVEQDRRAGPGALGGRVGLEAGHVDDREVGREGREVLARRPAEQVAGEDAGPGGLGVDAQAAAVRLVGADVHVLGVQLAVLEVRHEAGAEAVVVRLADLVVDLAPPDLVLAPRLADDELVLGRPAGVEAGADDERALGGDRRPRRRGSRARTARRRGGSRGRGRRSGRRALGRSWSRSAPRHCGAGAGRPRIVVTGRA